MARRIFSLVLITICLDAATAAAEGYVSPYIGLRLASDTTFREQVADGSKMTFGSSVGLLTPGVFGVEADISFVPSFFDDGSVTTLMGNVIAATPLRMTQYGLRPYFVGGFGLLHARIASTPPLGSATSSFFGMNVGGGAIGPLSPRSSVRFDVRYFRNLSHDEDAKDLASNPANLGFWRGTVGLSFRF